jgi:hypothetical protein
MDDPVEKLVDDVVHETFMAKLPAFVATVRHLIRIRGWSREKMLEMVRSKNPDRAMYLMMETEIDYLIAESQHEA